MRLNYSEVCVIFLIAVIGAYCGSVVYDMTKRWINRALLKLATKIIMKY